MRFRLPGTPLVAALVITALCGLASALPRPMSASSSTPPKPIVALAPTPAISPRAPARTTPEIGLHPTPTPPPGPSAAELKRLYALSAAEYVNFRAWVDPVFRAQLVAWIAANKPKVVWHPKPPVVWHPSSPSPPPTPAPTPSPTPPPTPTPTPTSFGNLASVVQCIKNAESGNYSEHSHPGSGSGAYQFIPGTWQTWSARAGLGGYSLAWLAPPAVQDAVLLYTLTHGGAGNWSNRFGADNCTAGLPGGG